MSAHQDQCSCSISLDQDFVYFGEEHLILRIPKARGAPQVVASTNGRVSALYVLADSFQKWIFWRDKDGGVYGMPARLGEWTRTFICWPTT